MEERNKPVVQQEVKRITIKMRLEKITKLMRISLTLCIVCMVALIAASAFYVALTYEGLESTVYLNNFKTGSKTLTTAVQSYAITGDPQYYDDYMQELNVDKNRETAWEVLQKNDIKADEWDALNRIVELSNGLVPIEEQAMAAAAAGDIGTAVELVFGKEYTDTTHQISDLIENTTNKVLKRLEIKKLVVLALVIVCLIALITSFIRFAYDGYRMRKFIRNEILVRLIKVSTAVSELSNGNLHKEFDLGRSNDEFGDMVGAIEFMKTGLANIIDEISYVLGQMGQGNYRVSVEQNYVGEYVQIKEALNRIVEEMRDTVGTIISVSTDIDGGAGELANAADDLANACTSQAGDVSDLMTLLGQLNDAIDYNANEAEEAVKISNQSSATLVANNQKIEELKAAMKNISECSDQIRAVISTISDIGNEINLLSLNASIESARAGEAGRGFAVVAEQVKKLAEESQNAVVQTSDMIKRNVEAVEVGVRIASETAAAMEEMKKGVEETNSCINGILEKLKSEVDSIAHINNNINSIADAVDNNSATSEEAAAISGEQKRQVESLIELMNNFQV